ncbi:antitoxin VbhA family protein [Deinococcus peraridilitoris]|uniref:Antitoxin VbhA domain-containing protein n=1 Tax=Deinococcus peraridilitoris (strain DSM 19664 / LMG 22246 / CIP 109416 / KR-200) TaxID=937777 RepID=L0A7E5_DEIPD|nr:antitoxin VbhA family protein [Deinococcus peraridilitoris]AFZ69788.1 hypothetical protein Deipe_4462 [Deinococcus peraridilitoris DSM 19664]
MTVITSQEREARRRADEQAKHELRLEGLKVSPTDEHLFEQYVEGELTTAQVRAALDAKYKKK